MRDTRISPGRASAAISAVRRIAQAGPGAQRREADLPSLPERVAWIYAYDAFALT